jgi:hypothetical protein
MLTALVMMKLESGALLFELGFIFGIGYLSRPLSSSRLTFLGLICNWLVSSCGWIDARTLSNELIYAGSRLVLGVSPILS